MTATGAWSPAAEPPPQALVTRFAEALARLWPEGGKLGLAVSGGPDSLAMLLLAEAAIPGRFEVATVDHGLRAESAQECAMVAEVCAARGIPCEILNVQVGAGNLQSKAREARYAALAEWAEDRGLSAVTTAHHADDQAETLLMRLNRGSGAAGLAGVREVGLMTGPIFLAPAIRPLLRFRRVELAGIIASSGLAPVLDRSNEDDRFDRARIRKAIAHCDWLDPLALSASAANLADTTEALEWSARREWHERVTVGEGVMTYSRVSARDWAAKSVTEPGFRQHFFDRAPKAVLLELLKSIMAQFGAQPRGSDLARLVDALERGESGNVAGVLATVEGDKWVFRPEPPRRTG